jgi:hypothetical protein
VKWSNQFVELDKSTHDRDSFDCSETELNEFIQKILRNKNGDRLTNVQPIAFSFSAAVFSISSAVSKLPSHAQEGQGK